MQCTTTYKCTSVRRICGVHNLLTWRSMQQQLNVHSIRRHHAISRYHLRTQRAASLANCCRYRAARMAPPCAPSPPVDEMSATLESSSCVGHGIQAGAGCRLDVLWSWQVSGTIHVYPGCPSPKLPVAPRKVPGVIIDLAGHDTCMPCTNRIRVLQHG